MSDPQVVIVCLRQPKKVSLETRADPFWEFGSFGCTGCHARLLRNLCRTNKTNDTFLAFVQGGNSSVRIVFVTPTVQIINHENFREAKWQPKEMPLAFESAPILIDNAGRSDFPAIIDCFDKVNKPTLVSKFASKFRARSKPLPIEIGREVLEIYRDFRQDRDVALARCYTDALPFPPPRIDQDRELTYNELLSDSQLRKGENS